MVTAAVGTIAVAAASTATAADINTTASVDLILTLVVHWFRNQYHCNC